MRLVNPFRAELNGVSTWINEALDIITARISTVFSKEHNNDGTHGDMTAESLTVTGETTLDDDLTINANVTVVGTTTAPKTLTVNVDGTNTGRWGTTSGWNIGVFQNRQPIWVGANGTVNGQVGFWRNDSTVLGGTPSPTCVIAVEGGDMTYSNSSTGLHRFISKIALTDGVAAPAAETGYATLYVDTADGDLKVIFGDGTIKTIVTDT